MPGSIARLNAALTWDLDDFDRGSKRIENVFGRLRDLVSDLAGSFIRAGKRMTLGITAPLAALSYFSVRAASNAEELQSAFDVTFGSISKRMNVWAEETGNAMGRATSEMQEGALAMGQLFNEAAPTADAAGDLSQSFAVLAQDAASFYNVDFDDALGRIRSGLTGEAEPLRKFGVFLSEAAVNAKAMEIGLIKSGEKLNENGKIMARAALITEKMAVAQGDVERTSGSFANQLRALKAELSELAKEIGERIKPAATKMIELMRGLVTWVRSLPDGVKNAVAHMALFAAAMGPVIIGITAIAATLLPLFVLRFGPVVAILSAVLNPIGTAIVLLTKFAGGWRLVGAAVAKIVPFFLRVLGPIGLAITLIFTFKDYVIAAFSNIFDYAQAKLGPAFGRLGVAVSRLGVLFDTLANSKLGEYLGILIKMFGLGLQAVLEFAGGAVITALTILIETISVIVDQVATLGEIVMKVMRGEWSGAWDVAVDYVQSSANRILSIVSSMMGPLGIVIKMMERLNGQSQSGISANLTSGEILDDRNDLDAHSKAVAASINAFVGGKGDYALAGSGKGGRKRGRSGPSKADLAARREELALQLKLDIARESGNVEEERSLQRQMDLRRLIDDFAHAGLSKARAKIEAEKAMAKLDAARIRSNAKVIEQEELRLDIQLAQTVGDHALVRELEDMEYVTERIAFWEQKNLSLAQSKIRAAEDLALLQNAENVRAQKRYDAENRQHQLELARLRGDSDESLRQRDERDRTLERYNDLRAGGASDVEARAKAIKEATDRNRAHLQGTFRDTFKNGLRAAMNGNLGSFFQNWLRDKAFNALNNVLNKLADGLANLLSKGNGGGGIFGALLGIGKAAVSVLPGGASIGNVLSGGSSGYSVSANGGPAALPKFASGGSFKIKGIKGIDQNLLSINGNPVANVSDGEIMDIKKGEGNSAGRGLIAEIHPSKYFDVVVDGRAAAVAGPMAQQAAVAGSDAAQRALAYRSGRVPS